MIIGHPNSFFDGPITQVRKSGLAPYSISSSCNWTRWRDAWIYSFQFSSTGNMVNGSLVAKYHCILSIAMKRSTNSSFSSLLGFISTNFMNIAILIQVLCVPDSIRTSQYYKLPTEVPSGWGWSFRYNSSMFGDFHKKLRRLLCHYIYIGGWRQVGLVNAFWFESTSVIATILV